MINLISLNGNGRADLRHLLLATTMVPTNLCLPTYHVSATVFCKQITAVDNATYDSSVNIINDTNTANAVLTVLIPLFGCLRTVLCPFPS